MPAACGAGLLGAGQRNDLGRFADTERFCRTDRLAHVAGREMAIVLLDHAGVVSAWPRFRATTISGTLSMTITESLGRRGPGNGG
jgi:hypothetical protein